MNIAELLDFSVKHNASDLHLSAGVPPMVRIDGEVRKLGVPAFTHADVHRLVFEVMNDAQRSEFEEKLEVDFSLNFRMFGAFVSTLFTKPAAVLQYFEPFRRSFPLDQLDAPEIFSKIANYEKVWFGDRPNRL